MFTKLDESHYINLDQVESIYVWSDNEIICNTASGFYQIYCDKPEKVIKRLLKGKRVEIGGVSYSQRKAKRS